MIKLKDVFFSMFLAIFGLGTAQEIKVFTKSDFDLIKDVKSCMVMTDYGKEEYDFNEEGRLTKSVTRYSDTDYDVVFYKFKDSVLAEKRSESYRDNVFDPSTSIAHFYTKDSTNHLKAIERIFSYDKEFLDEYIYTKNEDGDLIAIQHITHEGTDNTVFEYKEYKGEKTVTRLLDGIPVQTVRTSINRPKEKPEQRVVLTKEFLKGIVNVATEEVYTINGMLVAKQKFEYDVSTEELVPTVRTTYSYDENNMLISETSIDGIMTATKDYVYQYDMAEGGNWIKQIVTPENTYKTRNITYYEAPEPVPVIEE